MKKTSGFTIIELIITLSIISLLIFFSTFPIKTFKTTFEIKSNLSTIVSFIRSARQQALAESIKTKVYFNDKEIQIKKVDHTNQETLVKKMPLPACLTLQEEKWIGFNSQGHPIKSSTIQLVDLKKKEHRISISVGTGRVRLF